MKRDVQRNSNGADLSVSSMIGLLLLIMLPFGIPAIIIVYVGLTYFDISAGAMVLIVIAWLLFYLIFSRIFKKKIFKFFENLFR